MKRLFLTLILFISTAIVSAGGFQIYSESSTDVLSLGGAAVARDGHASAAWYNPAATAWMKRPEISFGGSLIKLGINYDGPKGKDEMNDDFRYTGFFYGVMPINDDFNFTLSVNAPYGMITQWNSDSQLSHIATYTSIRCCYISPGLVWKINDQLAIAGGPNMVIGVARLASYPMKNQAAYASLPGAIRNNKLYMRADGEGYGGWLAAFYRLNKEWAFGARYQSAVNLRLAGKSSFRNEGVYNLGTTTLKFQDDNVHTHITCPAYVALGVQNSTFEKWRFYCDAIWTDWSSYHSLDINFDSMVGSGQKGKTCNRRNWHDVWSYHFGAEYLLSDHWTLRCGYAFDISPNNDRHNSPEMPDSDKHLFTCGIGYKRNNWGVDLAYGYVRFQNSKLGTYTATSKGVEKCGSFEADCHILSLAFNYKF